jgi:hypothetical protein
MNAKFHFTPPLPAGLGTIGEGPAFPFLPADFCLGRRR